MQILFCGFSSNLSDSLLQKLENPNNKFGIKTTEKYYKQVQNRCANFLLYNIKTTSVEKILNNLDLTKASRIYQISAKFLKIGAPVIAIHLTSIINRSIKIDAFHQKCKIPKLKPLFQKGIKTEA